MNCRIIPSVLFVNFRKKFPMLGENCFQEWFHFNRYWGGKLIYVGCKSRIMILDFRKDWLGDMLNQEQSREGGER